MAAIRSAATALFRIFRSHAETSVHDSYEKLLQIAGLSVDDCVALLSRGVVCAALLLITSAVGAQVVPAASRGSGVAITDDSDVPDPVRRGWSATVVTTMAHDSLSGWSTLETPSLAYRINHILSIDAALPIYAYVNAVRTGKDGDPKLVGHEGELGDAPLSGHAAFDNDLLSYAATLAFTAPLGNEHLGLGTGHVGYNLNNHVEREFGVFTPDAEFGIGNSSALVRRGTRKSYTSSGLLGFFQLGTSVSLPASFNVDAEAYEQLPLATQTVYSRAQRKRGAVLTQPGDAEDNGVTLEVDAPSFRRLLLSASYSKSIRLNDTTEGISLAFLVHVPSAH